jgi:hypothetical protein
MDDDSPEFRQAVEDCKERLVDNVKQMRIDYPHLFHRFNGVVHEVIIDGR